MNRWSPASMAKLRQADPRLVDLANAVLEIHDCTVISTHRSRDDQERLFNEGKSRVHWPDSRHNEYPSAAIDLAPYPIDWDNSKRFYFFAGIVRGVAHRLGLQLRWGGDWDSDNDLDDQTFMDLVHFELTP